MRCIRSNRMVVMIATSLLFCIIWAPLRANGEDFFMGKVLSVNNAKNEIEVVPEGLPDNKSIASTKKESIFVQSKVALPACVIIGAKIRLWGKRLPDDIHTFIATDIRGCRGGGCSDPTGVRSRLSRRGQHSWSSFSHSAPTDHSTRHKGQGDGGTHAGNGGNANGNGGGK